MIITFSEIFELIFHIFSKVFEWKEHFGFKFILLVSFVVKPFMLKEHSFFA